MTVAGPESRISPNFFSGNIRRQQPTDVPSGLLLQSIVCFNNSHDSPKFYNDLPLEI